MLSKSVLYFGNEDPQPTGVPLNAGPLSLIFQNGAVHSVTLGIREVLHGVYAAVRDERWNTVLGVLSNLTIDTTGTAFDISYDCVHRDDEIDFRWQGNICGSENGSVHWSMDGHAHSEFRSNRIGFCVLHSSPTFAGCTCQIEHSSGAIEATRFPKHIAPHQPFIDVRSITYGVGQEFTAEVCFSGDVFETEDQRNWTDASFKTYSTPLSRPYPVLHSRGSRIVQSVNLALNANT